MNDSIVKRWVRQFKKRRNKVHDEERCRCSSVATDELVCVVDEKIKENRKFTINDFALEIHKFHEE